ncbi:hypothetical protein [Acidisoma sp.]|uniref:hypothetical protein n=1 Tax=Acidisoma sp. TaxID=1872115 RepID=UPI003B009A98
MVEKRDFVPQSDTEGASDVLGMRIGIKRAGNTVQISLQCEGDYQAIELYDRLVDAAQKGKVTIDLKAK